MLLSENLTHSSQPGVWNTEMKCLGIETLKAPPTGFRNPILSLSGVCVLCLNASGGDGELSASNSSLFNSGVFFVVMKILSLCPSAGLVSRTGLGIID